MMNHCVQGLAWAVTRGLRGVFIFILLLLDSVIAIYLIAMAQWPRAEGSVLAICLLLVPSFQNTEMPACKARTLLLPCL